MNDEWKISTVAVGTDGSARANGAVAEAAEIARRFEAELVLLGAFKDSAPAVRSRDIELQWATNSSARLTSHLDQIKAHMVESGLRCRTLFDQGEPAEVLVRLAADCNADLLVIGNKGMERRILGSVPNDVTHKAGCSVLVVKTA